MSAIGQLLRNEAELVGSFVALLQREQDALKSGDTTVLPKLA